MRLTVPIAIVISGAFIGTGLCLGLRGRPVVYVTTSGPAVREPETAAAPIAAPQGEEQGRAAAAVRGALESQRRELAEKCWHPSAKAHAEPSRKSFEFRMLFNPKGTMFAYAVNDPPDGQRLDVAKCLRDLKPEISAPATGRAETVQFALELP